MAKQTIDIGTTVNDGEGDPLRTAFDKCNDNFDELYTADVSQAASIAANTAAIATKAALAGATFTGPVGIGTAPDSGVELHVAGDTILELGVPGRLILDGGPSGFPWNFSMVFGNTAGIPGMCTNGYVCLNGNTDPKAAGATTIAGEATYMFGIFTDVASAPMIVLKADTGKMIKAFDGANTNVWSVEADGQILIATAGQTEINFDPNGKSYVSMSYFFGVGVADPLSKLHVEGVASNTVPLARFIGKDAGESVFVRIGLDAGGGGVAYWDLERDYASGDLEIDCNQSFALVNIKRGLKLTNLPTSNPAVAGQVWNDGGTLKVSAG